MKFHFEKSLIFDQKNLKMEEVFEVLNKDINLFGNLSLTIGSLLQLLLLLVAFVLVTELIRKWTVRKLAQRLDVEPGVILAVSTIVKYIVLIVGFFLIFNNFGIDLSALSVIFGALGLGLGFGLQNIVNNFVSGLLILFERPIKVGDRIKVGEVTGDITQIGARSTTILTNDNISIIVPNSSFITDNVVNWSHNDRNIRFNIPVGVSYNEDPEQVKKLLLEVVHENEGVLTSPPPDVLFEAYDDSALTFNLRVWTSAYINRPGVLKSQIYYEVFKKFKAHQIEIPFPQRDLHLKSGFEGLMEAKDRQK